MNIKRKLKRKRWLDLPLSRRIKKRETALRKANMITPPEVQVTHLSVAEILHLA